MANGRGRGRAATYVRGKGRGEEGVVWPGFVVVDLVAPAKTVVCLRPCRQPHLMQKNIYFLPPRPYGKRIMEPSWDGIQGNYR